MDRKSCRGHSTRAEAALAGAVGNPADIRQRIDAAVERAAGWRRGR